MSKKIDYPRSSFPKSIQLAEIVHSLGDNCSMEIAAEKMSLKVTGSFRELVGSAHKYNLLKLTAGKLHLSDSFKAINYAYTDEEKNKHLRSCFLTPIVFNNLFQKFKGKTLPKDILGKMLVRDYNVDKNIAPAVAKYFIEGLKVVKLINANEMILDDSIISPEDIVDNNSELPQDNLKDYKEPVFMPTKLSANGFDEAQVIEIDKYVVQFIGPGMNTRLEIQEEEDFIIVEATLGKIKKKLLKNASI